MNSSQLALGERFEIKQRLGMGGFGQVYAARDRTREEFVALKVLSESSASNLLSFKKEFRGLAGMHHPNLVKIYEMHEHQGQWFFTMELIHGVDFLSYARGELANPGHDVPQEFEEATTAQGDMPAKAQNWPSSDTMSQDSLAMRFTDAFLDNITSQAEFSTQLDAPVFDEARLRHSLAELYHGVMALHQAGILHRDIKPSNVLVDNDGRLVLLDFGLIARIKPALNLQSLRGITGSRQIQYIGTPHYMSPEQAMGEFIGMASDWYSIGAMLYECLTGRRPIEGSSPLQILVQKQTIDPIDVLALNPGAPRDLAQLCMRLLARDPASRPLPIEIAEVLDISEARHAVIPGHLRPSAALDELPFVGRAPELHALTEALEQARGDAPQASLTHVCGPSGIGKSALVQRFLLAHLDDPGVLVLQGRCFKTESVPYKALDHLIDMLSHYLEMLPLHKRQEISTGPQLAALAMLFPTLEQRFELSEHSDVLVGQDSGSLRLLAFDALRELMHALATEHTLLLFIDDVQWGDEDSALLIEHLMRPPNAPPMCMILSWRAEDTSQSAFLTSLRQSEQRWGDALQVQEIWVSELADEESAILVDALIDTSVIGVEDRDRIIKESKGNPLFVDEFARFVQQEATSTKEPRDVHAELSLEDVLYARINELEPLARRLLECVCVAGQPLERGMARVLASLEGVEQRTLSLLRSALLLRTTGEESNERLDVYHARIRDAVMHRMQPSSLLTTHESIASLFAQRDGIDPDTVAHHFLSASRPARAVPFLLQSVAQSTAALAFDRAARALDAALRHGDFERAERQELYTQLGQLYGYLGRGVEAATSYGKAVEFASVNEQVSLERRRGEQLLRVGQFEQGSKILEGLLSDVGVHTPKSNTRLLAEIAALRARLAWRGLGGVDDVQVAKPAQRERAELVWSAAQMLSVMDLKLGAYFASLHLLDSLAHHDPDHMCLSLTLEGVHQSGTSKGRVKSRELLRRAEELLDATEDRGYCEGFVCFGWGMVRYLEGKWRAAHDDFARAEHILSTQCKGVVWELDGARFYQLFCQEHLGGFEAFVHKLPLQLDLARARQDMLYTTNWRIWSYLTHLVRDQPDTARTEVKDAVEAWHTSNFLIQHFWQLIAFAKISLYQNSPVWALDIIDSQYTALKRSLLLQNETVWMLIEDAQAQLTLALILDHQLDARATRKLRARHEAHRQALEKSSIAFMNLRSKVLRLQLDWVDGERRTALQQVELLGHEAMASDMPPLAYALMMCRALMLGKRDELHEPLLHEATSWFASHEVVAPRLFARTLCPLLAVLDDR